jgi:hypothetical protein
MDVAHRQRLSGGGQVLLGKLGRMSSTSAASEFDDTEEAASPFRHAFGRARVEALAAGGLMLEDEPRAAKGKRKRAAERRFEYRLERRRGKRSADEADWNALGRRGWELVGVTGRHAAFKRSL